jgi:hypothetical protein
MPFILFNSDKWKKVVKSNTRSIDSWFESFHINWFQDNEYKEYFRSMNSFINNLYQYRSDVLFQSL